MIKKLFFNKIKESLLSILPITLIVIILNLTPLITIQLLGFTSLNKKRISEKLAMKKILGEEDGQIIRFL